jgi:hypothetical protein
MAISRNKNMLCPKCNSDNTQRLEVVFDHGTQDINTKSNTVGVGFGGRLGVAGATTKTTGKSQSVLAQKAAPPSKKRYKWAVILVIAGYFPLTAIANKDFTTGAIGIAIIALGCYLGYSAFQFNSKKYPSLYQYWLDSWLCNKCGSIYHHQA